MKKWIHLFGISLLLVACNVEEQKSKEEMGEKTVVTEDVEESNETKQSGKASTDLNTSHQNTWDDQILSSEGKALLLSGSILGTSLEIGSTLSEVQKQLGEPDKESFLAGAPLKSYGDIHISHQMNEDKVVAFFLSFDDSIPIGQIHKKWGDPTSISPMEIDGITEVHQYEKDGYIATFELTMNTPDTVRSVHLAKIN